MERIIRKIASEAGDITLIRLVNDHGAWVELSTLGAGIVGLGVPDKQGNIENVALCYANPADYLNDGPCMGKIPGRYANRIAKGHFSIDGKEYSLAVNNGPNALHGGPTGFQNRIWEYSELPNGVRFTYRSTDGEEGYPGNVEVKADYIWTENDILDLYLRAVTDAPTVINLTNHCYWNLRGATSGSVWVMSCASTPRGGSPPTTRSSPQANSPPWRARPWTSAPPSRLVATSTPTSPLCATAKATTTAGQSTPGAPTTSPLPPSCTTPSAAAPSP